ncbi:MAG: hypothetical protein ACP5D1_12535 [Bacteroidales bacterium]
MVEEKGLSPYCIVTGQRCLILMEIRGRNKRNFIVTNTITNDYASWYAFWLIVPCQIKLKQHVPELPSCYISQHWKSRITTLINVVCLSIGSATSILIFIFVNHEIISDTFHSNADRIYRAAVRGKFTGNEFDQAITARPMAAALLNDYPGVDKVVRLRKLGDWLFACQDKKSMKKTFLLQIPLSLRYSISG